MDAEEGKETDHTVGFYSPDNNDSYHCYLFIYRSEFTVFEHQLIYALGEALCKSTDIVNKPPYTRTSLCMRLYI